MATVKTPSEFIQGALEAGLLNPSDVLWVVRAYLDEEAAKRAAAGGMSAFATALFDTGSQSLVQLAGLLRKERY